MSTSSSLTPFLDDIFSSAPRHYHWLKSLSYLEFIGYRKMVKAVPFSEVNHGVYHHLSDEIQHSFMFRELAEKISEGSSLSPESLSSITRIAEAYFQTVDEKTDQIVRETLGVENPYLCYLGVSYLVEKRAMKVYPSYFGKASNSSLKHVVQKVIKDESEHLAYLEGYINRFPGTGFLKDNLLFEVEEECFGRYLEGMKKHFAEFGL